MVGRTKSIILLTYGIIPKCLESSNSFNEDGQTDVMMESIETFQELQLNNTLEKASPIILFQNSLNSYLAHYEVDNFDDDGYNIEVHDQVDTSYPKSIPP